MGTCVVETAPHFEEVGCMMIYMASESHLMAPEALSKRGIHLSILSKTNRANPNVAAGLCGSTEMHLRSEARKRDRRARKLKLRHEDATQSTNILTRLFHSFVLLDACPCLALKLLIRMTSTLRRSFRKVAELCLCKQSHIILTQIRHF